MKTEDIPVLNAQSYELYKKRSSAPAFHTADDKKGGGFTLHHIIPYRYPCFIGLLIEQTLDRLSSVNRVDKKH